MTWDGQIRQSIVVFIRGRRYEKEQHVVGSYTGKEMEIKKRKSKTSGHLIAGQQQLSDYNNREDKYRKATVRKTGPELF